MEDKMRTLKDMKEILSEVPDDVLKGMYFGLGEGSEEDINLLATESEDKGYTEVFNKYPKLDEINKLVKVIIKAQDIMNEQDDGANKLSEELYENGEGLTSEYFEKDKKSSPNQEFKQKLKEKENEQTKS